MQGTLTITAELYCCHDFSTGREVSPVGCGDKIAFLAGCRADAISQLVKVVVGPSGRTLRNGSEAY